MGNKQSGNCIFCKIVDRKEGEILAENENLVLFADIRPAATHHYLVATKTHVENVTDLKGEDGVEIIKSLEEFGKEYLKNQGGNLEDTRIGFHWPPFTSISHLHLHVISPASSMSFIANTIHRENSYYFRSPNYAINYIDSESTKSIGK